MQLQWGREEASRPYLEKRRKTILESFLNRLKYTAYSLKTYELTGAQTVNRNLVNLARANSKGVQGSCRCIVKEIGPTK